MTEYSEAVARREAAEERIRVAKAAYAERRETNGLPPLRLGDDTSDTAVPCRKAP